VAGDLESTPIVSINAEHCEKSLRLDDEVHFLRSWMEKPLATGAVMRPASRSPAPWRNSSIRAWTATSSSSGLEPAR